jgi:hypothetical protein
MKNDPNLNEVLCGKIILPVKGDFAYISADISKPSEFIFIPLTPEVLDKFSITTPWGRVRGIYISLIKEINLIIPDEDDQPMFAECAIVDNEVFTEEDFTWVGDPDNGCWAYYAKK